MVTGTKTQRGGVGRGGDRKKGRGGRGRCCCVSGTSRSGGGGKERGARDALLFMVLSWLVAWNRGQKVAVYCADVAGAFDRVDAARLLEKVRRLGVPERLLRLLESWLRPRRARVVLEGVQSGLLELVNMVFQGTVLGPPLWNLYYADCRKAVAKCLFQDLFFADDLNCWRSFLSATPKRGVACGSGRVPKGSPQVG